MSESSSIPSIGLAEFDKRYAHSLCAGRTPLSGTLEVTFRCNLNCIHCYCNLPRGDPDALKSELSTDEAHRILDQLAEEGCLWLLITGGEPLLRKDFLDLYHHAKQKGFLISLFSNATLLTPEIADHLAEWPPEYVEITLYGATEATYEKITRTPGSFRRCHRGIELLRKRKVPLKLKTMAMTVNHHELDTMKGFAETLGVDFRFDPMLTLRLDGSQAPAAYRLAASLPRVQGSRSRVLRPWQGLDTPVEELGLLGRASCWTGLVPGQQYAAVQAKLAEDKERLADDNEQKRQAAVAAQTLAEKFHGKALGLDALDGELCDADIVISSTGAPSYIVTEPMVSRCLRKRKNRLLFLIDIAVPRDIDPAVDSLENVFLYNIDDLQGIVDENVKNRRREAFKAEAIVNEEVSNYVGWLKELEAVPTIVSLRTKAEGIIRQELTKAESWLGGMENGDREKVEALVTGIVNKILHAPVAVMKEESAEFASQDIVAAARQLFRLDD